MSRLRKVKPPGLSAVHLLGERLPAALPPPPLGSPRCGWRAPSRFSLRNTLWDVAFHAVAVMTGAARASLSGPSGVHRRRQVAFSPRAEQVGAGGTVC